MSAYRYILKQVTPEGLWVSPEVFEGEYRQVIQAVSAGYLAKQPRWAEVAETGMFLYGLDRAGKAHQTGTSSPDFPY